MTWEERKKWKNDEKHRETAFYIAAQWQYEHEKGRALEDAHFSGIEGEPARAMTEFYKEANAKRKEATKDEHSEFATAVHKKTLRCGACHQLGHTSRSKKCPEMIKWAAQSTFH